MSSVSRDEVEQTLHDVGMRIGGWDRVTDLKKKRVNNDYVT